MENKTYVAIAICQTTSDSPEYKTLYEETTLLIKAISVKDATAKAAKYFEPSHTYLNADGFTVTTKLLKIEDVNEVLGIVDGDIEEINARFFRDYKSYSKFREMLDE